MSLNLFIMYVEKRKKLDEKPTWEGLNLFNLTYRKGGLYDEL